MKLFRYSGNKVRFVDLYRRPMPSTRRVVEPYLGSGAYLLRAEEPGLGYEANGDIVAMWNWLKTTSPDELRDLHSLVEEKKKSCVKPDARELGLDVGPLTYVRINVTGVLTGQLTAWKIYPQYSLPVENTIKCLPRLKDVEVVQGDGGQYVHKDGDLLFVDPPYFGTTGGYLEKSKMDHEKEFSPESVKNLLSRTSNPIIFTYGNGAPEIFPEYNWQVVKVVKVPNLRKGGTVDRIEWVSYINW